MLTKRIDDYCSLWRPGDADEREFRLGELLTFDVRYVDPRSDVRGIGELSAHIGRIAAARPTAVVERTTALDHHHELVRFGWHVRDGDMTSLDGSIDVVRLDVEAWKMTEIIGFFGDPELREMSGLVSIE